MPRLSEYTDLYADCDLRKALRIAMAADDINGKQLSMYTGIGINSIYRRLDDPQNFSLVQWQKLCRVLPSFDPTELLKYVTTKKRNNRKDL